MGFYLELQKNAGDGVYRESKVPSVYWVLYGIAGFALLCMGGAAHALLWDLAAAGSTFDKFLIGLIVAAVPGYLAVGAKMAFFRKYVEIIPNEIHTGFEAFGLRPLNRKIAKSEAKAIFFTNQRPSPNLASKRYDDPQYQIRGHWKVGVALKSGKEVTLDRHVEQDMLVDFAEELKTWLQSGVAR